MWSGAPRRRGRRSRGRRGGWPPSSLQCAAVRVADDVERGVGTGAGDALPDAEARRRHPVLPHRLGEAGRHRAVTGHPHDHGDEAVCAVELRHVAEAVGRVGQPVEKECGASWLALGLKDVGAIEVLGEAPGIDGRVGEVAIVGDAIRLGQLAGDVVEDGLEDAILGREVSRPVGRIHLRDAELVGDEGVPGRERRAAEGIVGADGEHGRRDPQRGGTRRPSPACPSDGRTLGDQPNLLCPIRSGYGMSHSPARGASSRPVYRVFSPALAGGRMRTCLPARVFIGSRVLTSVTDLGS